MAPAEQLFLFGKLADAVCTPSWRLCQDWTKYHNQVYLIPNFLETQAYLDCPKLNAPISGRVVGWAGSTSHIESFRLSSLPEAIKKLLRDRDDVYVYIAGGTPALRQITNHSHYVASGYVPFKDYPGLLKLINVGLIPLAGEYDNRRSILKALEYMILGIPWVGSNVELLQPLKEFGVLTANRRNEWVRAITWVLDEPQDKVIQRGIELAQLYDIDNYGVDYRLQIYEEIFNAKSTKHQIKPNFEQQLTPWAHLHASA
jgi:glycosyltransferase involved in cell wall biosynthesis